MNDESIKFSLEADTSKAESSIKNFLSKTKKLTDKSFVLKVSSIKIDGRLSLQKELNNYTKAHPLSLKVSSIDVSGAKMNKALDDTIKASQDKTIMTKINDDARAKKVEQENYRQLSKAITRNQKIAEKEAQDYIEAQEKIKEAEEKRIEEITKQQEKAAEQAAKAYQKANDETYKELERDIASSAKQQKKEQEQAARASERIWRKVGNTIASTLIYSFRYFTRVAGRLLRSLTRTLVRLFKSSINIIGKAFKGIFKGIESIIKTITTKLKDAFTKAFKKGNDGADVLKNKIKDIAKVLVSAFSIKALTDFSKEAVETGSDLTEVANVYEKAFGDLAGNIEDNSKRSLQALGLTELQYKRFSGTLGAMGKSMGLTSKQSMILATNITKLTGDVASFYNLDHDTAYKKLQAIYTGRMQPLAGIGVQMSAAALSEYALAKGIEKSYSAMSVSERLMVRYAYVLDNLKITTDDYIDTQKSFANQWRLMTGQIQQIMATLGQAIINIITPIMRVINMILSKLQVVADKFRAWTIKTFGDANKISGGAVEALEDNTDDMSSSLDDVGDSAEENAKKIKKAVLGFDELNKIGDDDSDSSSSLVSDDDLDKLMKQLGIEDKINDLLDDRINIEDEFDKKAKAILEKISGYWQKFKDNFFLRWDWLHAFPKDAEDTWALLLEQWRTEWNKTKKWFSENNILEDFFSNLGRVVGDIAAIGERLAFNLLKSFNKFLDKHGIEIKEQWDKIVNYIDKATENIIHILNSEAFSDIMSNVIYIWTKIKTTIVEAIAIIIEGLTNLFSKQYVLEGFSKMFEFFAEVVQTVCDSVISWLSGVFTYLEEHSEVLEPLKKALEGLSSAVKRLWDEIIKPFLEWLAGDEGVKTTVDIIVGALTFLTEKLTDVINFITDVALAFKNWGSETDDLNPKQQLLHGLLELIVNTVNTIATGVERLWKTYVEPFITWLVSPEGQEAVNKGIELIIKTIELAIKTVEWLWKNVVSPFLEWLTSPEGTEAVNKGIETIKTTLDNLWKNILEPLIEWATGGDGIGKIGTEADDVGKKIENLGGTFETVFTTIRDFIQPVYDMIVGIGEILGGSFEGLAGFGGTLVGGGELALGNLFKNEDLQKKGEKALDFSSYMYGKAGEDLLTGTLNIGKAANQATDGLLKLGGLLTGEQNSKLGKSLLEDSNKISSFNTREAAKSILSGGKKEKKQEARMADLFTTVPAYAQGGYLKPNQPKLMIGGDNKTQGEIISPVDKMAEVFRNVLLEYASQNAQNNVEPQPIILHNYTTLDGRTIYQETKNLSYNESNRQGNRQYR